MIFWLLGIHFLAAQKPMFRHLTTEDGLISSEVYGVFQDREGYLWFGTEYGVSRYNGHGFSNYSTDDGLSDNIIFEMFQDSHDRIWFHTFNGIPCYYLEGRFVNFFGYENVGTGDLMTSVLETNDSLVWVSSKGKNIIGFTPEDSSFTLPLSYNQLGVTYPSHFICEMEVEGSEDEHFATTTGFYKYDPERLEFEKTELDCFLGLANPHYTASSPNFFWTSNMEIVQCYKWNGKRWKMAREFSVPNKEYVTAMYLDSDQRIWVGTYKGVFVLENGVWGDALLEDYAVSDILEDKEGNFWFTTLKSGVFFAPSLEIRGWDKPDDLGADRWTALNWDKNRRELWMGNSEGRMVRKENSNFVLVRARDLSTRRSPEVGEVLVQGERVLLGTNSGLVLLDREGNEKRRALAFGAVKNLFHSESGEIVACFTTGVYPVTPVIMDFYDSLNTLQDVEKAHFLAENDTFALRRGRTTSVLRDSKGNYWFGTLKGLLFLGANQNRGETEKVSTLEFAIESIVEDRKGEIWIASHGGGLAHYIDGKFNYLRREDGLDNNLCKKLVLDSDDNVWVASNGGVTKVEAPKAEGDEYKIVHFSKEDGLISNTINDLEILDDTLWLASNKGLGFIPLNDLGNGESVPMINLDSVVVNGQRLDLKGSQVLEAKENNLSAHFTGISFRSAGKLKYEYRLLGASDEWKTTIARRVDFLSLSPGDYTLEVFVRDYRGNRSAETASMRFSVLKPWYLRWWAIGGGLGLLIGTLTFGFRRRLRNLEFQQSLRNNAAEADQRALRAQITPHFVFNALNSLQALIADDRRVDALKYTSRFSRLMRRIFEQSVENYIPLTEELETLELYLQIEQMRFKDRFTYQIKVDTEDPESLLIPSMLLQPIVENSIWHGLLHQEVPGEILVQVAPKEGELLCVIQDNGIGRGASKKIQSKYLEQNKSSGLKVTRGRIQTLSELNNLDLKLKIIDLVSSDGSAGGTRVEFTLPFITTTTLNEH